MVKNKLRALAAVVVLVELLDRVEHCVADFLVLVHSKILPRTEILVLAVELAETTLKDVALRVAQLRVFVDVHMPVQVSQRGPQIRRSFHAELAVEYENSSLFHELDKSLAEEKCLQL